MSITLCCAEQRKQVTWRIQGDYCENSFSKVTSLLSCICIPFLTHGSSEGRFGSNCNRSVAMENHHALRESVLISRAIYCTVQHFAKPLDVTFW